jgi:hypothetical protein
LALKVTLQEKLASMDHMHAETNPMIGPVVVSSADSLKATVQARELIQKGSDGLDAVIAGVNIVEDDPNDNTVDLHIRCPEESETHPFLSPAFTWTTK